MNHADSEDDVFNKDNHHRNAPVQWMPLKKTLLIKITTTEMPLYNGRRVYFHELTRPGRDVDRPPPSSMEVKEREELYLYFPSGPSWPWGPLTS